MRPAVLIHTHPADLHADAVQVHLDAAGVGVHRIDTPSLDVTVHVSDTGVSVHVGGIDLTTITCAWHRRPSDIATDPDDAAELRAGIGGLLTGLPYLNHPADMATAGLKPHQLLTAARCGLRVPETVITTGTAGAELADRRPVVVKPLGRFAGGRVTDGDRAGWQRPIHLTQQRIDGDRHIRLTVVDGDMYAAEIRSPHLDWRTDGDACRYAAVRTPARVAYPVRRLMTALRLRYAALDFAVDDLDRWWFLEINPNGQWLWIEQETGLPIAAAIAGALQQRR